MRRSKSQQRAIIRQMLQKARHLTGQGIPLGGVREQVAETRDDLVAALCQGIQLTPVLPIAEQVTDPKGEQA